MKHSATPATTFLDQQGVRYTGHAFEYKEHGGTSHSSGMLGVPEHEVVKTLIMENERAEPLVVLMHGDRKVSTKELARQAGMKRIAPCKPEIAQRHSGYLVGGTSPFATRKRMPVFLERSVLDLPRIFINGGRRGFLLQMDSSELVRVLSPVLVDVALVE
ncbi:MAG TPA: aminoacyl-tRNA deacylase [Usitatibacter sp.]|jgi:Cys-tRNA(Pro) deacylase|nr:aminoacyl-tRNA deacylase [Usitatibacter sp.]